MNNIDILERYYELEELSDGLDKLIMDLHILEYKDELKDIQREVEKEKQSLAMILEKQNHKEKIIENYLFEKDRI